MVEGMIGAMEIRWFSICNLFICFVGANNGGVSLAAPTNDAANAASSSATTASNTSSHKKDVWIFTEEELLNSPSRKCGVTLEEETRYRQKAVDYMKRVGKKLRLYVNKIKYWNLESCILFSPHHLHLFHDIFDLFALELCRICFAFFVCLLFCFWFVWCFIIIFCNAILTLLRYATTNIYLHFARHTKWFHRRQYVEIATAIVFFDRFFTRQSFSDHGNYVRLSKYDLALGSALAFASD